MPAEAPTSSAQETLDTEAIGKQLDENSLREGAASEKRIAELADGSLDRLKRAIDMAIITAEEGQQIRAVIQQAQEERMSEIQGDTSVKVANLAPNVLGQSDGKGIWLSPDHIRNPIYKHENQHVEDGIPAENIDADLAPKTDIAEIDERLKETQTVRDNLEDRATEAQDGEEESELYLRTHVAKVKEMEQRGSAVGVDIKAANEKLATSHNAEAFKEAVVEVAAREIAQEEPEKVGEVIEKAESQNLSPEILNVLRETRDKYENGPHGSRQEQVDRELAISA